MSNVAALYSAPDVPSALTRPLYLALVAAGFPSPADDHLDRDLDLHELLIQHPASTFYVRLSGDSMQGAGLYDGGGFQLSSDRGILRLETAPRHRRFSWISVWVGRT
jgi:hypothetical protein